MVTGPANVLNVAFAQERSVRKPDTSEFNGRLTANSRPSSEKMDKQFYKLSEWREPEKQTLVIDLK